MFQTLRIAGLEVGLIHQIIAAAAPLLDLGQMASHTPIQLTRRMNDGILTSLDFVVSKISRLSLSRELDQWKAKWMHKPITRKVSAFQGVVESNLWNSAVQAGVDPQVISQLADIYGWQIDFEREVHPQDRWTIVIEQQWVEGELVGWGDILAANYVLGGTPHRAVRFTDAAGRADYFSLDGSSLKAKFLKSPLRYTRISSTFQKSRFHPILGYARAHNGVDYAAPTGTPIRAVGDGRIVLAGRQNGSGKMIKIKHNGAYETAYKHLNAFAPGIVPGTRVEQGQVIGFVGMTGLATGPHLHFEFYVDGRYTDPMGIRFPRADGISGQQMASFKSQIAPLVSQLSVAEEQIVSSTNAPPAGGS